MTGGNLWDFLALTKRSRKIRNYSLLLLHVIGFRTDVLVGGQADILTMAEQKDEKNLYLRETVELANPE